MEETKQFTTPPGEAALFGTNMVFDPLPWDPFYNDPDYTPLRKIKIILINSALHSTEQFSLLNRECRLKMSTDIEIGCLDATLIAAKKHDIICSWTEQAFEDIYHNICYKVISLLNIQEPTGSRSLIEKIFNNKINLKELAALPEKDLCPEKYADILQYIDKRSNAVMSVKYTELHFCRKCKRNQATEERVQNRSNDEGCTYRITCLFCGNKWFGG